MQYKFTDANTVQKTAMLYKNADKATEALRRCK